MRKLRGTLLTLLNQQSGQIQLLIVAPILTLSFLSLVVRTASSAVDSSLEKKKVTEQLKRRLSEVQSEKQAEVEESKVVSRPKVNSGTQSSSPPQRDANLLLQQAATSPQSSQSHATQPVSTPLSPAHQLLLPLQATVKIGKKTTLATLFHEEGLEEAESTAWLAIAKKHKELRRLTSGKTIDLSFSLSKKDNDRELRALSYELDQRTRIILEKKSDGKIVFRKDILPLTLVWKGVGGRIIGSLYKSVLRAGLPKNLIDDLADLDWDIDLSSDLHQGDTFKVIFEEFQLQGKPIKNGKLLAATVESRGKTHFVFSFPEPRSITVPSYSSRSSSSFLRYPLRFTRITSVFTDARLHPILERVRPHTGIDFAAPRGTPVRSIANGKVTCARRQSGYGLIVRIDHPGPYDTAYAHLDRIAENITEGATVAKGQIIGFVGSTGLATGPHLHFEMYKNGEFINPLTAKLETEDHWQEKENPIFTAKKQRALEQFSAMKIGDQPVVLTLAYSASGKSSSRQTIESDQEERFALATSSHSPSLVPGLSSAQGKLSRKRASLARQSSRPHGGRHKTASTYRSSSRKTTKAGKLQAERRRATQTSKARGLRTARR
jgi:murein DD-endopeptidase MepM/ murein hydrolase activator NlpD